MRTWYKKSIVIIGSIILFFPVGLFLMWKYAGWNKKVKWAITSLFAFVILISLIPSKQAIVPTTATPPPTQNPSPKPTLKPLSSPVPAVKPANEAVSSTLEKIEKLVAEKYPNFEVTIWNKDSELATEGEIPYEVILNGSFNETASSCDAAKKASYYMLETFYKDNEIRPILSRVLITFPYYLRVSLGASDGVSMAEGSGFSGPTNFWKVVESAGMGENEQGEMEARSWAVYLTRCK
ncbi:hypothetical protein HYW42_00880 [Candidatus Daviesbacteria bacterium]|nr:hypothetical protein [Candidatus Daviesbacteria bacterium]